MQDRKIVDYIVIGGYFDWGYPGNDIQIQVKEKIKEGYFPIGGVECVQTGNSQLKQNLYFYQSMVKYETESEKNQREGALRQKAEEVYRRAFSRKESEK